MIPAFEDAVFDGKIGKYSEDDIPNPINVYASTKLESEIIVNKVITNGCILRTNHYGWNALDRYCLAEWMLDKLEKKNELPAFKDIIFSPILINNLANALIELYEMRYKGIIHIAARDSCTKLDFAYDLAEVFKLDRTLVVPTLSENVKLLAKRSKNMSLCTNKAKKMLKTKLLDVKHSIEEFKKLRDSEYVKNLKKMANLNL